ncbi:MAG: hypothetical protein KDC83_07285 [Flavobacteriales bacterium]|nr:hypothetical protein [Flavobacteriales bacterium]
MQRVEKLNKAYEAWKNEAFSSPFYEKLIHGFINELIPPYTLVNLLEWNLELDSERDWKFFEAYHKHLSFLKEIEKHHSKKHLYFADVGQHRMKIWHSFLDIEIRGSLPMKHTQFVILGRFLIYKDHRVGALYRRMEGG